MCSARVSLFCTAGVPERFVYSWCTAKQPHARSFVFAGTRLEIRVTKAHGMLISMIEAGQRGGRE